MKCRIASGRGSYEDVQPALTSDVPRVVIDRVVQEMANVGQPLCHSGHWGHSRFLGPVPVREADRRTRHMRPVGYLRGAVVFVVKFRRPFACIL